MYRNLLLLAAVSISAAAHAQTTTTFNYTGSMQTFTVPNCVYSIDVDIRGAKGGNIDTAYGGKGGQVTCTLPVTPGEVLQIFVGGVGSDGDNTTGVIPGGFNGGGTGFDNSDPWGGGGGGGASDIRRTPYTLNDRLIVAGGGGGGGIDGCSSANKLAGGVGGGLIGGNGMPSPSSCVGSATGGTQSAGGLKGQYTSCGNQSFDGAFGIGGDGYGNCNNSDEGGSGGGGGWYGGGGGNFGAGGGGSSYTSNACTNVVHNQGVQSGNGVVTLTYTAGVPVSYVQSPNTVCINWPTFNLTSGTPPGGTYSGAGVSGSTFNAATAGVGPHNIIYTYYDSILGCTSADTSVITVMACTGTGPDKSFSTVSVYPNPFTNNLSIAFGDVHNATVFIYNMLGESIGTWKQDQSSEKLDINTSKLVPGFYFVTIRTENGNITKKLIKE